MNDLKFYKHLQPDQRKGLKKLRRYVENNYDNPMRDMRLDDIDRVLKRGTFHQEEQRIFNMIRKMYNERKYTEQNIGNQ